MLAIHLNRDINSAGFKPNLQKEATPVFASAIKAQLGGEAPDKGSGLSADAAGRHHPMLLQMLAEQVGCSAADIVDFELNVCDTQPGADGDCIAHVPLLTI